MNQAIELLKERGFFSACTDIEALSKLFDEKKVTFYVGCDPTGPSLHIGHMVPFFAAHHLQLLGHNPIVLVGGGTAMIGDPSGKTEMRKMLTLDEINSNKKNIKTQLSSVIDFSTKDKSFGKASVEDNANWLLDLNYIQFLREIGKHFSVNKMLTFESYKKRLEKGLSFIEFNYQLLQSYDFLKLIENKNCQLQIGGEDQWGNIVAGIDLIRRIAGRTDAYGMTFTLVTRADGQKMGKSEKGAIFLDKNLCSVYDFFQYWRNVNDQDVFKFMKLFTFLSIEEIEKQKSKNINEAKEFLAYEVTKIIHSEKEADKAMSAARAIFSGRGDKSSVDAIKISRSEFEKGYPVLSLFTFAKLTSSNSEARRLLESSALSVSGKKISDAKALIDTSFIESDGTIMLQSGKKKFALVEIVK